MKVFNVLVNAPQSLLRLLVNIVGSLYHRYTTGTPVVVLALPKPPPATRFNEKNIDTAIMVFPDIEDTPTHRLILSEVGYAKPVNIPTFTQMLKSGGLFPIPETMDAPFEAVETRYSSRMSHTTWILWFEDGTLEVIEPRPTRGYISSGPDKIYVNDPADPMPKNVTRAMKVMFGTELIDNTLRGCRWIHYVK